MNDGNVSPRTATSGCTGLGPPTHALPVDASLFLDFDGTLVEIAAHPDAVVVTDHLRILLTALSTNLPGRVGIISGRPLGQLRDLIGPLPLAFAGSHGAEILWPDGTADVPTVPDGLDDIARQMSELAAKYPGVYVESKPYGVALHYRSAPQAEASCRDLAMAVSQSSGLTLQSGKMVFELRVPGFDKGTALRLLSASHGFLDKTPVFVGDDDTDEAAFIVAAELGGAGVLVGPARPTAARFRLESVGATIDWLEGMCREVS